jgi:ketosteroid isomerase-like protein
MGERSASLPRIGIGAGFALAGALTLAAGCGRDEQTPETRVRAVLAEITAAAEARDASALKPHLSDAYADAQGNDKAGVMGVATYHFLQHRSVHLFTRVRDLAVAAEGREARADVVVAMAGTAIPGPEALTSLRADLYRFDVVLQEEPDGLWRVVRADWRPASLDDFR